MKEKIVLMAKDMDVTSQIYNFETGKLETIQQNTLDPLREHGVPFVPMPEDYVLKKGKEGKEDFKLGNLGTYIIAKINEDGQIINEFNGKNIRRPLVVDVKTILALAELFREEKKPPQSKEVTREAKDQKK